MTLFLKSGVRRFAMLLCFFCLLWAMPGAEAHKDDPSQYIATCLVRNQPSEQGAVIGQMENGTYITVLARADTYFLVDCYDMTGYIHRSQLAQRASGEYYVNCTGDPAHTATLPARSAGEILLLRAALLTLAQEQLGDPYVYGGSAPGGFDCSGLTSYLYKKQGISLHRRASLQMQDGLIIAREGLQIGDLLFFRVPGETTLCSHVGIYAGEGRILHAGSKGIAYAELTSPWYSDYYLCARRILNLNAQAMDPAGALPEISAPTGLGLRLLPG